MLPVALRCKFSEINKTDLVLVLTGAATIFLVLLQIYVSF
jgi:hypothetical protein